MKMSNSSLVNVTVPAHQNNYGVGRNGKNIKIITIHHMAGVLTAEECGKIFQDGTKKISSHYGIGKDGKIGLYVDEENIAYTNGNFESNSIAVTIEASNSKVSGDYPVSNEVLNVLIKLIADIAKRNNLGTLVKGKNLTWHKMYVATSCPGEYLLSKIDYIVEEANKINKTVAPEPQPKPELVLPLEPVSPIQNKKSNEEIANEVIAGSWGNGNDRKVKLTNAGYDFSAIQKIVNEKLLGSTLVENQKKSNEEIASEVIRGEWGNGDERKNRLIQAGYDYNDIQKIVNNKLK